MVHVPVLGRTARCIALCAGLLLAALASMLAIQPAAASAQGVWQRDCSDSPDPCIRYCWIADETKMPCGVVGPQVNGRVSYTVPLSAATQNATGVPGDPGGSGTSYITLDLTNNQVCATTYWSGIDSPVVMAHIHAGAYGQPENPAVTLSLFDPDMLNGRPSGSGGCFIAPAAELYAIKKCPAQFNVVVHSQKHPVGAVRGQLGSACEV